MYCAVTSGMGTLKEVIESAANPGLRPGNAFGKNT